MKQHTVAQFSAEAKYQTIFVATSELAWMELVCDSQVALHIASKWVFHERTKHIESRLNL